MEEYELIIRDLMNETGFDREDAVEIVQEGMISFLGLIAEIEDGYEKFGMEETLRKLHKLKGASANLRMKSVARKIAEVENFGKSGEVEDLKKALLGVKEYLQDLNK